MATGTMFTGLGEVVTVNIFCVFDTNNSGLPKILHVQTKEVARPLFRRVFDPTTLVPRHLALKLYDGYVCEFCDQPATGFMSSRRESTPWIDFADQIQGRNELPVRGYFPVSLMSTVIDADGTLTDGSSLTGSRDTMGYSEHLKKYGHYGPCQSCIVIRTCKKSMCNTKAEDYIATLERKLGLSPSLPWMQQPFTTAMGDAVCQYCGSSEVRLCQKNGEYCGYGYCCKEHQVADWPHHQKVCKHRRSSSKPSALDQRNIFNHSFVGDPLTALTYQVEPERIDTSLLNTETMHFLRDSPSFAKRLEVKAELHLEGPSENEPYKCVICKTQPAVRAGAFQSIPVTSKDQPESNKVRYYKAMLHDYFKVGAFPGESFDEVWKLFDETRAVTAQMVTLSIPVCHKQSCLEDTTRLNELFTFKLAQKSEFTIDTSFMYLTNGISTS